MTITPLEYLVMLVVAGFIRPSLGDAVPARAGRSATRAMLRCLGHSAPIAIAVFALSYFAAALVSGAGQ